VRLRYFFFEVQLNTLTTFSYFCKTQV